MQYPDENPYYPSDKENSYGWLMQFADGTRIDLTVQSINHALNHIQDDKLCRILLDKENILPEIVAATDCQYWVKKPTEEQYLATCNEFWWCTNNIAKGLWRKEIPYVQDMANYVVRPQLIRMLDWKAGILTGWAVSTGKSSKYLYQWLSEEEWKMLLSTYFDGNVDNAWKSVWDMCELFGNVAQFVGEKLGWEYSEKEGKAAYVFIRLLMSHIFISQSRYALSAVYVFEEGTGESWSCNIHFIFVLTSVCMEYFTRKELLLRVCIWSRYFSVIGHIFCKKMQPAFRHILP